MEHDPGPRALRVQPVTRRQASSTLPAFGLPASRRSPAPPSPRHDPSSPHARPLPQAQDVLPPQRDLRPESALRPQFRLRPGHDDALIHWLASLSPRQRSRAIRTALCQYLAEQREARPAEWREDPDLAHALDSLF